MLCDRCHKNEASVFYEEITNGKARSLAVCADCANEQGGLFFPNNLFASFFGHTETERSCPLCHTTLRSFSKDGKVGCPECYQTFAHELESTIHSIHGNVKHIGRIPEKHTLPPEDKSPLASLKAQLKAAIDEENFELAATLRDQIKALETGNQET